jgi:hydrogenase maturation factor
MGKLTPTEQRRLIRTIRHSGRLLIPPRVGFDSGVHRLNDDLCMVVASDPCLGVPMNWFGWLLIHYASSDVALFGAPPRYCSVNLLGPPDAKPSVLRRIMSQASRAAAELGIDIVTGHTGTYSALRTTIGTCTTYGFVRRRNLITPAMAKQNDQIICTKPLGLEILTNLALTKPIEARQLFGPNNTKQLTRSVHLQSCVSEALTLAKGRLVSAMHDATEGGLATALNEMADASRLGFTVGWERIPILPEMKQLARHYRLTRNEILACSSTGMIIASTGTNQAKRALSALAKSGLRPTIIGRFTRGRERLITVAGRPLKFPRISKDPYARIMGRMAAG